MDVMAQWESSELFREFPEGVRQCLKLDSLDSLIGVHKASGATRLLICPDQEPVEALTLVYCASGVKAAYARSGDDIWDRITFKDYSHASVALSTSREFSSDQLPSPLQTWPQLADSLPAAISCYSDNPEGSPFFHLCFGGALDATYAWLNPTQSDNPKQMEILNAYSRIKRLFEL